MEQWLDAYPPSDKDDELEKKGPVSGAERRSQLLKMKPQRTLDLHGCRAADAADRVDEFIDSCVRDGLAKVLIVHGKGKHSTNSAPGMNSGGIIKEIVYERIRLHRRAGEAGIPDRILGGSGAVWVALRSVRKSD